MASIASLVIRAQPAWYLSGSSFSGRQYISYKGDNMPIEAQTSPSIVYHSLFDGFAPSDTERNRAARLRPPGAQERALAHHRQAPCGWWAWWAPTTRSGSSATSTSCAISRHASGPWHPSPAGSASSPPRQVPDPRSGGNNAGAGSDMIATNTGYSDEAGRARLLADLIYMAFVCDITRVATLQITVFQSHMNVYPDHRKRSAYRFAPTSTSAATTATPRRAGRSR